ncbi:MAG: MFS transporter [Xanthobacteraceae bacterium]|nr:MFS transporter [Xanthobacteraceae bacterium]
MLVEATAVSFRAQLNLIYAARGVRGFGDGFAVIILPAYLSAIGFTPVEIGLVATAALLGSSLLTLVIGFVAPRHDLRTMLMLGAALAVATGIVFPQVEHLALVLLVAFVGTINPQVGDSGVLVPLEHAMLARGVAAAERTRAFARYSLTGALATAAGALAAATPDVLVAAGFERIVSFKAMFYAYAALGVVGTLIYRQLPHAQAEDRHASTPLGPSRFTVYKLAALFSLDSFAGGLLVQSLLALWLFERFDLSLASASLFFFWSGVFTAFSYPVAARLSKHIGLINTMVFTHIPASLFLIAAAFATNLYVALALLLVRAALSQMDVPARSSYVMAVVTPAERTAAASVTAVPRSLASSLGPAFAGFLLATPFSGLPLIMCGALKIVYDLALLYSFRHVKPPEEQKD